MSQEQDKVFFRNFTLVVGAIAVMMVLFFISASIVTSGDDQASINKKAEDVAERTKPVGTVVADGEEAAMSAAEEMVADAAEPAAAGGAKSGEEVYNGLCKNCHGMAAMAAMMPQYGDAAAWEARIAKGMDTLYEHAIAGFQGDMGMMPAKGGNPSLSDEEVKAAVDYIIESVQ